MKKLLIKFCQFLTKNMLIRIFILSIITLISAIIANFYELAEKIMLVCILLLTIIAIIFIIYAWIINPIRRLIDKKNKK